MLIAMAGLPGTGKSTLARRLAALLPAIVLDKDTIRAALFPPAEIDYSTAQNDLCLGVMYDVAGYLLRKDADRCVILDGRTFTRCAQVDDLLAAAARLHTPLTVIECVCADEVARRRLAQDVTSGGHPAANRTLELYTLLKAQAEPLMIPRLVIETDDGDLAAYTRQAIAYIHNRR